MTAKEKPSFVIREVTEQDIPEVSHLAHRIWRQHYPAIIGMEQVEYMLGLWYSPEFLQAQHEDEDRLFLVAEQDGELLAYIQSAEQEGFTFIYKLYVTEKARGMGIGKALLEALPGDLPLKLRVNRHNHDSVAFYKRQGFEITGEDVLDIGNGFVMDDYIMQRPIFSG